jgi:membrane-bound lytic murein transglycosylase D
MPAPVFKVRGYAFLWIMLLFSSAPLVCQQGTELASYSIRSTQPDNQLVNIVSESANAYEYQLEVLNRQTPLELEFNSEVKYYIDQYLNERRVDLILILQRAQLFFPLIEEHFDRYGLPLELKYIAVLESGLNPFAKSTSGAVGLWQFLYNTCSLVDLKVNSYIDERRDPYKSTEAACRYLRYLYSTFNDWNLAMAAYNGGPRDVRNAIALSGGKTDYWELRPYLSEQAQNYVPKFIALNYVMNYYQKYGVQVSTPGYTFANTDTIHIQYAVSFAQISSVLKISVAALEKLNPVYIKKFIPDLAEPCVLILPSDLMVSYLKFENQIIAQTQKEPDYNSLLALAGSTENRTRVIHTVKPGEFFHKIALNYGCTVENLKAWNHLGDSPLYPGQSLAIWISTHDNANQ